jgi:hypothetical protein
VTITSPAAVLAPAAGRAWAWPLDPAHYDRRGELDATEIQALGELGWLVRRRRGHNPDLPQWRAIRRLLRPLDDARAALGWCPDTRDHQRAVTDAIGLTLYRCHEQQRSYWAWSADDWLHLIAPTSKEFTVAWPGWIDGTVRPYVAAFAYLIGGFTGFDRLGAFNRQALAWRIFGKDLVEDAVTQVTATLRGWGYHPSGGSALGFRTVLIQSMLVNRSPLLEDMTSEALATIRADPSTAPHHARGYFHGMHKAISALGHAGPPPAPVHAVMPEIEGVPRAWTDLIERWFATSTLTSKVRGIFRSVMAKAGRWLAAEHPDVSEPTQWTRQTCASWVAAVDRMRVGDYVQRKAGLSKRGGKPLSPPHQGRLPDGHPHPLPRRPGMGLDPAEVQPSPRAGHPEKHRGPHRAGPAGHRRRRVGQAAVGRAQPRARRLPDQHLRPVLPDGDDPGHHAGLAVQRAAKRRDLPAAGRLRPVAARRDADPGRLRRGPGPRRGLPARHPGPQDRHRVHQAR